MGKYFGTDGVRGIANKELTPELAFKLGRYGGYVLAHNENEAHPKVLVGRDTRIWRNVRSCFNCRISLNRSRSYEIRCDINAWCCILNKRNGC